MMLVVSGIAVGLIAFILYALDRKAKGEPIAWDTAAKLTTFSGLITSGVVFATTAEIPAVVETVKEAVGELPAVQEMFVGVPTF
jgi:hypothetical protein